MGEECSGSRAGDGKEWRKGVEKLGGLGNDDVKCVKTNMCVVVTGE